MKELLLTLLLTHVGLNAIAEWALVLTSKAAT